MGCSAYLEKQTILPLHHYIATTTLIAVSENIVVTKRTLVVFDVNGGHGQPNEHG